MKEPPIELLRQAKMLPAEQDLSLNDSAAEYRRAGERLLELAKTPLLSMPDRLWNRSSLYD